LETGRAIRAKNWQMQKEAGLSHIPSNDFSFYDHILDAAIIFGAIPKHYLKEINTGNRERTLEIYFNLARGRADGNTTEDKDVPATAWEMTKWFGTNYHYIVPELEAEQKFELCSRKPIEEFLEAKELGIYTRPVIIGPVSFLKLAKMKDGHNNRWLLLPGLLQVYRELFNLLKTAGADWIQIDEPCLVLDLDEETKKAYTTAYKTLANCEMKLLLSTYFAPLGENMELALGLPTRGIHIDFTGEQNTSYNQASSDKEPARRAADLMSQFALPTNWPQDKILSAGIIDGRNIWACDLNLTLEKFKYLSKLVGNENLLVAPSCSLLHVPVDLDEENKLDTEILSWLSFAKQKLKEISLLTDALNGKAASKEFEDNKKIIADHRTSTRVHNQALKSKLANLSPDLFKRKSPFAVRKALQQKWLNLPLLPTTTIGSFPQTKEIRKARADYKASKIDKDQYKLAMQAEIKNAIDIQNDIGLDVLVHGEAERNDMVEYFAEFLDGYVFTEQGWVQSYGSRCVKPPIIFGDIVRRQSMTVEWSVFAQEYANQSSTKKSMKGMLTGPVTMLQWSFVRSDQSRSETCKQLAWAIREEVLDLESHGIKVIQVDEPAIREGLPLKKTAWKEYLKWAVECFRLVGSSVKDETQIHTHMCYSEFNDIIDSVGALDADVVSIEAARSRLELLDSFVKYKYPNDIGPGVWDIHSPRIPPESEMTELLEKALAVISAEQLWVNPDCGLKTRGWAEVTPALRHMVAAAKTLRSKIKTKEPAKTV
jgi:5-methyltetrahydropteroyltriglutamate--homocysteine methyltransferase